MTVKNVLLVSLLFFAFFVGTIGLVKADIGTPTGDADPTFPYPALPPGTVEVKYDDGDFAANGLYALDLTVGQQHATYSLRVRFTPPPEAEGGVLQEARLAMYAGYDIPEPQGGHFILRIKDAGTGSYMDSPPQTSVGDAWKVVDVSGLGFTIDGDFYVEVHAVTGERVTIYVDDSSYSGRSEHYGSLGNYWYPVGDIGYNVELGIRAIIRLPTPAGVPEFSLTMPIVTSLATALYLAIRKRKYRET